MAFRMKKTLTSLGLKNNSTTPLHDNHTGGPIDPPKEVVVSDKDGVKTLRRTTVTGENLFTKQLSVAGITTIESTTDPANDTATAALNVSGGAVIEKKVFLKDITSVTKDTDATNSTTAAFVVTGGVGIGKKLFVDGDVTLNISNSNTHSTILYSRFNSYSYRLSIIHFNPI